ncbi:MAG: hypothetical protein ACYC59_04345 [Anaerolineaceae bacterium]
MEIDEFFIIEGNTVMIDGVFFSFNDCPPCLEVDSSNCDNCVFFIPSECRIRKNEDIFNTIQAFKEMYLERNYQYVVRSAEIVNSIKKELSDHGRPLHYSIIAKIVGSRYPKLNIKDRTILRIVASHPDLFENLGDGVIQVRKK